MNDTPKVDPKKTKKIAEWKHDQPMLSCRIDPTGAFCIAGAHDALLQRWEIESGENLKLQGHQSWIRGLEFHAERKSLFSGDYAGNLFEWPYSEAKPEPARKIKAHDGWVRSVSISPDGALVATGGNDNLVRVWSAESGEKVHEFAGHERHVYYVHFHPDGRQLVSADLAGAVKHWDLEADELKRDLDATVLTKYDKTFRADCGGIRRMQFSADASQLACAGITDVTNAFAGVGKPMIIIYDWESGELTKKLRPEKDFTGFAWGLTWHPEGFLIGVGGGNSGGALWFFRPDEEKSFFTFSLPSQGYDIDLHPDGRRLAVAHYDKTLRMYSMEA